MVSRQETANFKILWLFSSGHFLVHFLRYHGSKNDQIQKSCFYQKSVFSCSSTTRRNFWNPFILRPYFYNCLPELLPHCTKLAITFTSKLFDPKSSFWHDLSNAGLANLFLDNAVCSNIYLQNLWFLRALQLIGHHYLKNCQSAELIISSRLKMKSRRWRQLHFSNL